METMLLNNMCRICLKSGCLKLLSLYKSNDDDEETPRSMLNKLTGINLEDENLLKELPKKICKNCICEMNLSFQFYEKALQAAAQIEHYLTMKECKEIKKSETIMSENIVEHEIHAVEDIKPEQNQESSSDIEEVEEILDDECHELLGTTLNDLVYAESSISTKNSKQLETANTKIRNKINRKQSRAKSITAAVDKSLSIENEQPFKKLSKRGRKPKTEVATSKVNVNCHVCEICGNVFTKRGRLTEHLRRHETEAKYACELCDERFLLREGLRHHMFQHLGGKPFKCNYCSRTFFYESVKKAHEAVHAGHKPYVCDKCNKAFAYPHALKKHKLIHDDIKLYSCKYCKKDFRLQHHMKQHEETKAHINAVRTAKSAMK